MRRRDGADCLGRRKTWHAASASAAVEASYAAGFTDEFVKPTAIAGFAGSFFAAKQRFISPESFTFIESAIILAIVVLGGMGSQVGVAPAAPLDPAPFLHWLAAGFGAGEHAVRVGDLVVVKNLQPETHTRLPGYVRGKHGIVVRGPDGRFRALADRTQAPSGAGYALENAGGGASRLTITEDGTDVTVHAEE